MSSLETETAVDIWCGRIEPGAYWRAEMRTTTTEDAVARWNGQMTPQQRRMRRVIGTIEAVNASRRRPSKNKRPVKEGE